MANLPPLVVELIAKTDGFQAGLTRAAEAARKSSGDITGAFEKIQGALGAIGVGLSAAAISSAVKHTTELGDELFKMSQRVGVSVENLSTLRYSFDLAGVSMEDMDGLLVKLNKKLGEAGAGSAEAGQFLKQFGINVAEIRNGTLTTDEALKRIADRFASSPDGINKTAAAIEAFGKSGAKIIPFLNSGREGIEALQTEADKLGLKLSTETAQRMEAFNDQLRTLEFASEGARAAIIGSMLPALESITKAMRDATIEGGKFAGIMAGLQTLLTGGDQYKNDKRLVELTEKKLQLENDIAAARREGKKIVFTNGVFLNRGWIKEVTDDSATWQNLYGVVQYAGGNREKARHRIPYGAKLLFDESSRHLHTFGDADGRIGAQLIERHRLWVVMVDRDHACAFVHEFAGFRAEHPSELAERLRDLIVGSDVPDGSEPERRHRGDGDIHIRAS